jgi:hypothetical protein
MEETMALQISSYNSKTKQWTGTHRYCSAECFDTGGWSLDEAEPCDLGEFTCGCGERFTVTERVEKAKYLKITGCDNYLLFPMSEGVDKALSFIAIELRESGEVGDTFTIEVVEMLQEAVDFMPEFDGF